MTASATRARSGDGDSLGSKTSSGANFLGEFAIHFGHEFFDLAAGDTR
jgi:hypothetical protein